MLSAKQKEVIDTAIDRCDDEDKSTEYMLQYAAGQAHCDIDDVCNYLYQKNQSKGNRKV